MNYIVGLGNFGSEYEMTRHNVGFMTLDYLVSNFNLPKPVRTPQYLGSLTKGVLYGEEIMLLYPETFMNHSGSAVKKLVPSRESSRLIVLYDDVALPFGELKISFDRGDGGHNGIKSIISALGTKEFVRVRIGVGPTSFWTGKIRALKGKEMSDFVLGKFNSRERVKLEEVFVAACGVVEMIVREGYVKAMNKYN